MSPPEATDKFVVGVIDALNNGQVLRGGVVVNIRVTYCPRQSSPGSKCSLRLGSFTCRSLSKALYVSKFKRVPGPETSF